MGKAVQSPAAKGGESITKPGTAENLLYPPAYYYDCKTPFTSLRAAWRHCRDNTQSEFIALLTVKTIVAYDKRKQRVPWPMEFTRRPCRLAILFQSDDGAELWGTVFGAVFQWKDVLAGMQVLVRTRFDEWNGTPQLGAPERLPDAYIGRVVPIYYANRKLGAKDQLATLAAEALRTHKQLAIAILLNRAQTDERALLNEAGTEFPSLEVLLEALHAPLSGQEGIRALDAARALSVASLRLSRKRFIARPAEPESVLSGLKPIVDSYVARLPFPLTLDQQNALQEIITDMEHHQPMSRLISGDVGTGKTLIYLLPALAAQAVGARVGILIPNLLVSLQVERELAALAPDAPRLLLTGASGKAKIDGNPIVIGTTAILSRLGKYPLHLLIVDEQQKMSEAQRSKLVQPYTNVLEATATAVPRTAALVEYGSMDVSILRTCPYQKHIVTKVMSPTLDDKMVALEALRGTVMAGGQIAVVYPRVSASERGRGVDTSINGWEKLFPGNVVVLHGQMTDDEKEVAISTMKDGRAAVLVATSVIEVGITLPSLKAMLITDPDMFGLSQLHQLRGRLARHGGDGMCFLAPSKELDDDTQERLRLMETYSSGFDLQEADMALRGFGNFLNGESQTGNACILFDGIRLRPNDLLV